MNEVAIDLKPPAEGWDLHCHTVFSDGTKTPQELVTEAKAIGLHGIAITDHDTTAGWKPAEQAAREEDLPLIRGTEITAQEGHVSVHMLAYQYDPRNQHICDLFEQTRAARLKRVRIMVERLSQDFPITWDDVLAQVKQGEQTTIGRPHIADALVALGIYKNRSQAFSQAISSHSKYYVPTPSPSAQQVIRAVSEAGGVSVIAHAADPSRNRTVLSDEQIGKLAHEGLDGLEVWHRGNPESQRHRLLTLARRYHLLVTGGSDWHGAGKPNKLGEHVTDDATVAEIIARGAIGLWV